MKILDGASRVPCPFSLLRIAHCLRDLVQQGVINIKFVRSSDQEADIMMKRRTSDRKVQGSNPVAMLFFVL